MLERLLDFISSYSRLLELLGTCTCQNAGAAGMKACLCSCQDRCSLREPQLASACMQHLLPDILQDMGAIGMAQLSGRTQGIQLWSPRPSPTW